MIRNLKDSVAFNSCRVEAAFLSIRLIPVASKGPNFSELEEGMKRFQRDQTSVASKI